MKKILALMLAAILMVYAMPTVIADATQVRMTRCNLRLRAKASTESDTLTTIPGGTEILVMGASGGWTKTSYEGHTGFISSSYLMDLTRSGYYPLKEGDENQYVREMQVLLIRLGYMSGSATGKFESDTTIAVQNFQKENGLNADGVAGGETQTVMYGETARGYSGGVGVIGQNSSILPSDTGGSNTLSETLKLGSRGDAVQSLQARLIELGYLSGRADGVFGEATEDAVETFQKRSNLSADGKAGNVTQAILFASNAPAANGQPSGVTSPSADTYTVLKLGMTSNGVKKMQEKLISLGYLSTNATGYYGSATQAAVASFQEKNKLQADGIAGAATQEMLYSGSAAQASGNVVSAASSATQYAPLKQGMKSSAVTTMQKKLKEYGYLSANATGYFGSATLEAVNLFQRKNGLKADGIAGNATLALLYSGGAVSAGSSSANASVSAGKISGPSSSTVKLLHWNNAIKPSLKHGNSLLVFDPATSYGWNVTASSLGRHLEAEPNTSDDTAIMNSAFGNTTTWTPKTVYVKLPSGTWTMATMHNTPHLSGKIKGNNFDGHLCVHFLRDMAEAEKNDPKYGVQNQNVLRASWKKLTGETVK